MSSPIRPPLWITEADGNPSGRPINKIVVSNGTLSIIGTTATITTGGGGGGGSGTVTNVSSTDSFITITNPNTTPSITISDASGSDTGVLSSTDWTTFNNKTSNTGTVTSVGSSQAFITIANPTTTPSISIGNASGAATGVLTASDWTDFDGKQDALSLTTTGTSGAATLVGATLNIPQYSGGGGGSGTVTSITPAADSGTGTAITTSGTFTYTGGTGVTTSVSGTTVTINADNNGTVGGSGALQQVATWSSSSALTGSTNLTFDGTKLYATTLRTGGSVTTLGATDLTITTNETVNSGSIVISNGVNGQISITPNGTGTIKLDGVELDNSAIATGYVLKATSASAAGWAAESGSGGSPAGSNTEVQFNNSSAFGASSNLTFDGTYLSPNLVKLADGSNTGSSPYALGFATDDDTGLYKSAANQLAFSTGGSQVLTFGGFPKRVLLGEHTGSTATSLSTYGTQDIVISTNQNVNSGTITITDGVNGDISLTPNGTGAVEISGAYKLPTAVTATNDFVLTAQTDGSTAWAASGGGGVTFPLEGSDGSAAAPTYSFSSQTSTGIYYPASSEIGFSINGNERMKIKNNAIEGITFRVDGTDTAATPGFSFDPDNDTGVFSGTNNTLSFSTGGSERLRIGTSGEILIGGTAAGTSGQVFTSGGPSAPPTWVTSSGGGSGLSATDGIPQVGLPTTGSNLLQFPLIPIYTTAITSSNGVISSNDTVGTFFQFFGHQTGDIQSLTCELYGTTANNMQIAVYSVDSNNLPSTRVGDSAEWNMSTSGVNTIDLSGLSSTISITKGDMYYLGLVIKGGSARPNMKVLPTTEGYSFNIPSNTSSSETVTIVNRNLTITGLTASTWPTSLTTANLTGTSNQMPNMGVVY